MSDEAPIVDALKRLTGRDQIGEILMWGKKLPARYRTSLPRICPICLEERGYLDAMWELYYAAACPYHAALLIDRCPSCGVQLSWNRSGVDHCKCGDNLLGNATPAGQHLVYLSSKLWAAAGQETPSVVISGLPDASLDQLSLEQTCRVYRFLSSYAHESLRLNRKIPLNVDTAITELEAVWSLLADWPKGFSHVLDLRRDCDGHYLGEGLRQAFGKLYGDLYGKFTGPEFEFIRLAFEKYIDANWPGVIDGKYTRIAQEKSPTGYVPLKSASKMIHIAPETLTKFIQKGIISSNTTERPSGKRYIVLKQSEMEVLSQHIYKEPNFLMAKRALGISRKQLHLLIENGELISHIRPEDHGLVAWQFDSKEIKTFLQGILAQVPENEPNAKAISFSKACQCYILGNKQFLAFLQGIRTGSIRIDGIKCTDKNKNLNSLYFSSQELATFRDRELKAARAGMYSIREAAVKLGVHLCVAQHLANRGLLDARVTKCSIRGGRMISEEAITSFKKAYVPVAELARRIGASAQFIMKTLQTSGMTPVIGPTVDGCRQIFYRRSDLPLNFIEPPEPNDVPKSKRNENSANFGKRDHGSSNDLSS